jgi:membrane protein YqaA with SNARE-associated domain
MGMMTVVNRLYKWMESWVHSVYAHQALAILFYVEALLFLPADPLLIFYCMQRKNNAFRYALIATAASVLGGITVYAIGGALWHIYGEQIIHSPIINTLISPATFYSLSAQYKKNMWLALLLPALIPMVPYKAITLSAGFCQLSLIPFIICSCIARGSRYLLYATIATRCPNNTRALMKQSLPLIMTLIVITVVGTMWFLQ